MKILNKILQKNKNKMILILLLLLILSIYINYNDYIKIWIGENNNKSFEDEENIFESEFMSEEFEKIQGEWEIIAFIDVGIESHSDEIYEENLNIDWDLYRKEKEKLVGTTIQIYEQTIDYYFPAGEDETGYIVDSYENMFFGYKPPTTMLETYPVLRYWIVFKDCDYTIHFILDANEKGILDINGDFYNLKKI